MKLKYILILSVFLIPVLNGCARIELASHFGKKLAGENAKSKGMYKVGSPYKIKGRTYYPAVNYSYNEKGMASWYGPNFHGKKTANGERFDQNDLTAAHKTLPLPSIVRVTNLDNGKSLIVRVNDRGPYAHDRIIDLSKRSAELLGFRNKGIAKVRVQVLETESRKLAEVARNGGDTRGMEIPMNRKNYKPTKYQNTTFTSPPPVQTQTPTLAQYETIEVTNLEPASSNTIFSKPNTTGSEFSQIPQLSTQKVFVQTGAFSTREAAMKYSSSLDNYGRAQIYPAYVNGAQIYRVRFPSDSALTANTLLDKLVAAGYHQAIVVVD